jgi:hypothetical protein
LALLRPDAAADACTGSADDDEYGDALPVGVPTGDELGDDGALTLADNNGDRSDDELDRCGCGGLVWPAVFFDHAPDDTRSVMMTVGFYRIGCNGKDNDNDNENDVLIKGRGWTRRM